MDKDFKLKYFVCSEDECGARLQENGDSIECSKHPEGGIISKGRWYQLQRERAAAKKEDKRFERMTQEEALAILEENTKLLGRPDKDFKGFD